MNHDEQAMLEVLRSNKGFERRDVWVQYAIDHRFVHVDAHEVATCPNCGSASSAVVGQMVYYSTLLKLRLCSRCHLAYVDVRIDPAVLQQHFESAYKDENYFRTKRDRIFDQLARQADVNTRANGLVLDVGGAKGHLMAKLQTRRPDLVLTVNDLSSDACEYAAREYGLRTLVGGVTVLEQLSSRFDTVVMSDVIYYEPEIKRLFEVMPQLVVPGGTLIIRVPNKLWLIRAVQIWKRIKSKDREKQTSISFFNPEHLYIFSQRFLVRRLSALGFTNVRVLPSRMLIEKSSLLEKAVYFACQMLAWISLGRLVLSTAVLVVAQAPKDHSK
jgi:2-polyprenyl-3-methyl-5-hydroxy-6-metoxy-1,4-benzoquinol methylase